MKSRLNSGNVYYHSVENRLLVSSQKLRLKYTKLQFYSFCVCVKHGLSHKGKNVDGESFKQGVENIFWT